MYANCEIPECSSKVSLACVPKTAFSKHLKAMTVEGYFGTMAETTIRGIIQNFRLSYVRQIETMGKTDDKTNPPRGGDSGRFF